MANIDKRVVEMKFDNAAFERGVATTLGTLDKLKGKLNFDSAGKGLSNLASTARGINLNPLAAGVDAVSAKFSALQVAGVAALGTIVAKATSAGLAMAKSLTIAPISGGLGEYEKKLGSIQTILANTQAAGTNLTQVSAALEDLNRYSDQTIYNFGEMAKNIGTFTAAGVGLETATSSIKGIANLAALSGSSSEQASTAMYQLSQAISAGKVSLMDWNSVVNAGMGGSVFQRSLAETAVAMGKLPASAVKLEGAMKNVKISGQSFRESISAEGGPSWLTSDVLTTALGNFTGDMKEADLVAQGFSKSQAALIMKQAQMARDAATVVKTGTQLMSTLSESAESGWAQTWELIIGDFNEAPKLWTGINNAIGGIISRSAEARNAVLGEWKKLGGRTAMVDAVIYAWRALVSVVTPIREAWRNVFPPTTGKQLADLSIKIRDFAKGLILGEDTMKNLGRTFQGVFSVIKIASSIFKGLVTALFDVFGAASQGGGGILALTAIVGDFLTAIQRILTHSGAIQKFFSVLVSSITLIGPLLGLISGLASAISLLVSGDISGFTSRFRTAFFEFGSAFDGILDRIKAFTNAISDSFGSLAAVLGGLSRRAAASGNAVGAGITAGLAKAATFLSNFYSDARGTIEKLITSLESLSTKGQNFFAGFGGSGLSLIVALIDSARAKFDQFRASLDFSGPFSSFNAGATGAATGGMAGLAVIGEKLQGIFSFLGRVFSGMGAALGPFLTELSAFFTTLVAKLREYLKTLDMQDAVSLLNTGFFIALYIALRKFAKNLGGLVNNVSETFGQLTSTLKSMQSAVRANIIMQIAVAVGVLVAALFILAKIDAGALKVALIALTVVFGQVAAMLFVLTRIEPQSMIGAGLGMIALATAIVILASAIKKLGELDPQVLIQGSIAIGILMAAMAGMAKALSGLAGVAVAATGLLILSAALMALTFALKAYASIPLETLADGLIGMAAALIAIGFATRGLPLNLPITATGLVILSGALVLIAGAIKLIGMLSMSEIAKGLTAIIVALSAMAIAMQIAQGAAGGAAAILLVSIALVALANVLTTLSKLSWGEIFKGLGALLLIFGALGLAALVLTPVIPIIAILAVSILALGAAMVLAGTGMALFAGGLALMGTLGAAGFAVIVAGFTGLMNLLPLFAEQAGHAVIAFAKVIGEGASKIVEAFVKIIVSILKALDTLIPKIIQTVGKALVAFVQEIAIRTPQIALAGLNMIVALLAAVNSRIYMITSLAILIVQNFLRALSDRIGPIIQSGVDFIIAFITGLAQAIRGNKERTGEAGADLAKAIVEGMIAGLKKMIGLLPPQIEALGRAMVIAFKRFLGINSPSTVFAGFGGDIVQGLINGVGKMFGALSEKMRSLATAGIIAIRLNMSKFVDVGRDIVSGMLSGLSKGAQMLANKAAELARGALDAAKRVLGIESPSKEFQKIGEYVNEGFAKGLTGSSEQVQAAYDITKDLLSNAMKAATTDVAAAEAKLKKLTEARDNDTRAIARANQALAEAKKTKDPKDDQRAHDDILRLTQARNRNNEAIKATTATLLEARKEYELASGAYSELANVLAVDTNNLKRLADEHDTFTQRIEAANKVLEDSIKTRDDYAKQIYSTYADLPDISGETTVEQFITDLKDKIDKTQAFTTAVQALRDLGLSDTLYKELLAKGINALPFVEELMAGGTQSVTELNNISSDLDIAADKLGADTSKALYQAGVDSAQGLVSGLQSQQAAIAAEMARIAAVVAEVIRLKLEIKSPSRVMAKIGSHIGEGLADGMKRSIPEISRATDNLGQEAIDGMKKSIFMISDFFGSDFDFNPTITPVLDLSAIRKEATKMGSLLAVAPISIEDAYSSAAKASSGYRSNIAASFVEPEPTAEPASITFVQNNTSPKALSAAEIYRQTNNQLSVAKGALTR